jgi:hypothetical protein
LSAKEYTEWKAYYSIRPWGEEMQDYRIGMVTQSVRAPNSKNPVLMKDCIPVFEAVKENKTFDWKAASAACKSHTLAMGGKVK